MFGGALKREVIVLDEKYIDLEKYVSIDLHTGKVDFKGDCF